MLSTFSANLETLPNALPDSKTAAWWLTQPEAWSACRQNLEPPRDAMARYVTWLKSLPGKPVFVAYPTAFDFPFVYWYLTEFVGENPFGYSAIDIKTYSMALMRKPYRMCGKRSRCRRNGSIRSRILMWRSTTPSSRGDCSAIC